MKRRYRPRRLLRRPRPAAGRPRRLAALLLCLCLVLALVPPLARAAGYSVSFYNYDMSPMEGDGYAFKNVPEGTALYTAEGLKALDSPPADFTPQEGCTWYLYYSGGDEVQSFGPTAIPDPPAREGYTFRDWAVQNAAEGNIYTVTGDTVYVARYVSDAQYVLSLYYQFDNESHTVAAETDSLPFGWEDPVSIPLPDDAALAGLSPAILPALEGEEAQEAAAWLTRAIKDNTFSCMMNDELLKYCRAAGFVAWDESADDYLRDENGNIQIGIPVTYRVTGTVEFTVEYWQQNAEDDGYTLLESQTGSVEGTTVVHLTEMEGMVPQYDGFTLTAASAENAERYTVNANDTTTIKLYYDRNERYILYQMNGGAVREPLALRFGQTIPESALDDPARTGYTFAGWTWLNENGDEILELSSMPDHDVTLAANWTPDPGASTVTLVYWLENANDSDYTMSGSLEIPATAGQTAGYEADGYPGPSDMLSVNQYLGTEHMAQAGIPDGAYFTFLRADASTEPVSDTNSGPKTVAGDGSTVINLYYSRNVYTLTFHLGWVSDYILGLPTGYYVASGKYSTGTSAGDWKTGYETGFLPLGGAPDLNIGGRTYSITDDSDGWYRITEKYGAFISNQWPVQNYLSDGGWFGFRTFYGWGTHALSPYAQKNPETSSVINGAYSTMSADLIINAADPSVEHHLVAYYQWDFSGSAYTYHHMFEVVPGIDETGTPFSGSAYEDYTQLNDTPSDGFVAVQGRQFYEYGEPMNISSLAEAAAQNHSSFSNLTYRYGCYNGNDIYFFYTYNDYTVTYHENNANDQTGIPAGTSTKSFHYAAGAPLSQQLTDYDYTPDPPYVSRYGNEYVFDGWYLDPEFRYPVDWDAAPTASFDVYAKWIAPTFTLTLVVPEGELYPETLKQFAERGYECTPTETTDPETGLTTTTYVVTGIPGGIQASQIVSKRQGAWSILSLAFDYWGYEVNGTEQRYLFDESQYITSDLTLTARWKTEYTGQYTVRYLTDTPPQDWDTTLGTVTVNGETWYRLLADRHVTDAAVGSTVTVEAQPVEGYLSSAGSLSGVVGQEMTYFDFFYDQVSDSVDYTVHYVLDAGVDYGRAAPPEGVTRLAADKTVTVDRASLNESTAVRESAVVVGGHSPRDGWTASFTLSADAAQNHLYIYYVPNTYEVELQVTYHFADAAGDYTTGETLDFQLDAALGRVFTAGELTQRYQELLAGHDLADLEAAMVGHELDTVLTLPSQVLTQTDNVYHIFLKNAAYTLTYCLEGSEDFPAAWEDPDEFLTAGEDGTTYAESVTYPAGATSPTTQPTRLGHTFLGWSDTQGGDPIKDLTAHPWFHPKGMTEDHVLYAVWEEQLTVTYDLRGGEWLSAPEWLFPTGEPDVYFSYADQGGTLSPPPDPSLVTEQNVAHAFVGWTTEDPDSWTFEDEDNRIDLDEFERYRYDFDTIVTESLTLYAVWDPDVTDVTLAKVNGSGEPLARASFTLERIQASVSAEGGGYTFTLPGQNPDGSWPLDASFPARSVTTDDTGGGAFENLPAGYYLLTETAPPAGYLPLDSAAVLHLPYGEGEPEVVAEHSPAHQVTGKASGGDLTVTVTNTAQYDVEIISPKNLVLTYTPPDLIWNPETLAYEGLGGAKGSWAVTAEGSEAETISVINRSPASPVQVSVQLTYQGDYTVLLPQSSLSATGEGGTSLEGFNEELTEDALTLLGSLSVNETAVFSLTVDDAWPGGPAALPPAGPAGTITISVTHPRRLNPAWQ